MAGKSGEFSKQLEQQPLKILGVASGNTLRALDAKILRVETTSCLLISGVDPIK